MRIEKVETNCVRRVLDLVKEFGSAPVDELVLKINKMLPKESGVPVSTDGLRMIKLVKTELNKANIDSGDRENLMFILLKTSLAMHDSGLQFLHDTFLALETKKATI